MKRVLLYLGSARRGGNTELLADQFLAGAAAAGHVCVKLCCAELSIAPCLGCRACCAGDHSCARRDDMQIVYDAFWQSDVVALASPVYFDGVSAQTKAMIDRLYCVGAQCGFQYPRRECVLLMTAESKRDSCFDLPIAFYRRVFETYMGWTSRGTVLVHGVDARGDILGNPGLDAAFALGRAL